ncbi:MAG: hypothetical protein HC817_09175 [Saprospiraceae bacterium]|nr:hypothetical protein [Saprospiraceae bacterium]
MNDALRTLSSFPSSSSTVYSGTSETVASEILTNSGVQTAVVDWVLVELRSSPSTIVKSKAALLLRNGDIVATDGVSPVTFDVAQGSYHIDIRHRNHLGVMTASPVTFSLPATMTALVDFTLPSTMTYQGVSNPYPPQKSFTVGTTTVTAMYAGDANGDDTVRYNGNGSDRAAINSQLGSTLPSTTTATKRGYFREDINMNGQVKLNGSNNDRIIILNMIGVSATTTTFIPQQF